MGDRDLHKQPGQSKEAPAKKMRRTIQAAAILKWTSADDGRGGSVSCVGVRTVRIPCQITWRQWTADPTSMPDYLLRFIMTNKGDPSDEMRLYSHPERFYPGENWITDDIDRMGAIFLTTKEGQSDLAFSVKGKHVYAFESDDYIVEDVEVHENTQHVKDFAPNHLKNELYPHKPPGSAKSIGEMVKYESTLKSATLCSYQISMKFYSKQEAAGSAVLNWRAVDTRGELLNIYQLGDD